MTFRRLPLLLVAVLAAVTGSAQTLRICTWNTSLFTGTDRLNDIRIVLFNAGPAGAMDPDIVVAQEIQSPSAATAYLGALNSAEPNKWAVIYGSLTGTDSTSDSAIFYKPNKVSPAGSPFRVAPAGGTGGQPRDTWRFDFHIVGDADPNEVLAIYDVHMKAGSTSDDVNRRNIESQHIRTDSNSLPGNYRFILAGDTNIQTSSQSCYQTLIANGANSAGRFVDPISTPGSWNNNSNYRFVHTQDPIGAGGMDDRFDQILVGPTLVDGQGADYVGHFGTPYSTTTWNDPNHSYRCWGNDGTCFNNSLTVTNNQMVGPVIAQSIINAATPPGTPGGHCPVFLDLHYAVKIHILGLTLLQNHSVSPAGILATFEIHAPGSPKALDTQTIPLGAGGSFDLTTPLPPGTYDVYVKASHWLRGKVASVKVSAYGASLLNFSLRNGDVNGDNRVGPLDFADLQGALGSTPHARNWNSLADLDGDGVVTLNDLAVLQASYGAQGE
ncbi:MAG TPA: dockerin type I domain-containing protein [Fimbriimonadaceae bacterium]|nr:dockerin type I domain-containing protein [Fimbriimonadaceae bacterium]